MCERFWLRREVGQLTAFLAVSCSNESVRSPGPLRSVLPKHEVTDVRTLLVPAGGEPVDSFPGCFMFRRVRTLSWSTPLSSSQARSN